MKPKLLEAYMKTAKTFAELSHARRLHVGAIVVKDDRIVSIGYNGMPAGWDNNCEMHPYVMDPETCEPVEKKDILVTRPEVLHAETNAIAKLARSTESGLGADLFVTHSPCLDCAKIIYQSGIKRVYFGTAYRDNAGVNFLKASGVEVSQIDV